MRQCHDRTRLRDIHVNGLQINMDRYIIAILFCVGAAFAVALIILFRKYVSPVFAAKCELIKQQLGDEQYNALVEQIKTFMACAEVQIGAGNGKEKSKLVIQWIKEIFPEVREDYVQALIDGFMKVLTNEGILNTKK